LKTNFSFKNTIIYSEKKQILLTGSEQPICGGYELINLIKIEFYLLNLEFKGISFLIKTLP